MPTYQPDTLPVPARTFAEAIADALTLGILGVIVGYPWSPDGTDLAELSECDNTFDDAAYTLGWRPWGWVPGTCINCRSRSLRDDECLLCGWMQ